MSAVRSFRAFMLPPPVPGVGFCFASGGVFATGAAFATAGAFTVDDVMSTGGSPSQTLSVWLTTSVVTLEPSPNWFNHR